MRYSILTLASLFLLSPILLFAQNAGDEAAAPPTPADRASNGDQVVMVTYYRAWSHIQVLGPGKKEELVEIYRPYGTDNQQANMKLLHKELNRLTTAGYEIESTTGGSEFLQYVLVKEKEYSRRPNRPER